MDMLADRCIEGQLVPYHDQGEDQKQGEGMYRGEKKKYPTPCRLWF